MCGTDGPISGRLVRGRARFVCRARLGGKRCLDGSALSRGLAEREPPTLDSTTDHSAGKREEGHSPVPSASAPDAEAELCGTRAALLKWKAEVAQDARARHSSSTGLGGAPRSCRCRPCAVLAGRAMEIWPTAVATTAPRPPRRRRLVELSLATARGRPWPVAGTSYAVATGPAERPVTGSEEVHHARAGNALSP